MKELFIRCQNIAFHNKCKSIKTNNGNINWDTLLRMSNCTQREINITFVNILHSSFIVCLYMFCRWRTDVVSLTGLTAPYACPKPGPRLNTEYNRIKYISVFYFHFSYFKMSFSVPLTFFLQWRQNMFWRHISCKFPNQHNFICSTFYK